MLVARTFAQNKLALIGVAVVVIIVILFSFIGPLVDHTDQINPNLIAVNLGPGGGHPLGTDSSGFDILGRLMKGGQSSIEVGIAVGLVSTVAGLIYGAIAGYFGGGLDSVLMRIVDIGLAIPIVFLFIFMAQIYKPEPDAPDRAADVRLLADPGPPRPRGDAEPANARVRAGRPGDGRALVADHPPPHHPEHHRRDHGHGHVPDRRTRS